MVRAFGRIELAVGLLDSPTAQRARVALSAFDSADVVAVQAGGLSQAGLFPAASHVQQAHPKSQTRRSAEGSTMDHALMQRLALRPGFRFSSARRILRPALPLSEPTCMNVTRASDTWPLEAETDTVAAEFFYPARPAYGSLRGRA